MVAGLAFLATLVTWMIAVRIMSALAANLKLQVASPRLARYRQFLPATKW